MTSINFKQRTASLLLLSIMAMLVIQACQSKTKSEGSDYFGIYGDSTITEEGAIAASDIPAKLQGKDSIAIKVTGTIGDVCQAKGCWMNLAINEDENMTVRFKDYGFFMPKNSSGKTAVMQGYAYVDTVSVAQLQHKAKDAGKSDEDIAKITESEVSYAFMADGVIIK